LIGEALFWSLFLARMSEDDVLKTVFKTYRIDAGVDSIFYGRALAAAYFLSNEFSSRKCLIVES